MEEKKMYKVYRIIMIAAIVSFITFFVTSVGMYKYFSTHGVVSSIGKSDDISKKIGKYKSIIDRYYLGEVDEQKLSDGAIKGYIEALDDPYTEYISKEEMEDFMAETTGNFVGVGVYMVKDTESNKVMVLSPIEGSPAEKAGIQPGDFIISADGVEYSADDMSVLANKIKGEAGTTVKLEILRKNETLTFELKRESIKVNPVNTKKLENDIGYLQFSSFDDGTAKDFKEKYLELEKQGIKSLIIDLRNNGGGIVDEALEIADYIADKDSVLLYEVDKNNKEEIKKSKNNPIINMPIVILTNKNTASSSEILSGALKDLGKAKIVGTTTYGKGVIQQLLTMQDGSGIKITSEKYLTPNKTEINKIGIEPDEKVELPDSVKNVLKVEEKDDAQLQKAIEMLK